MQNERPVGWWRSTPKIVRGKFLCVAIDQSGEETTNLFSLEELQRYLTPFAADFAICAPDLHASLEAQGFLFCGFCGQPLSR